MEQVIGHLLLVAAALAKVEPEDHIGVGCV
jgi:hypothetical protein